MPYLEQGIAFKWQMFLIWTTSQSMSLVHIHMARMASLTRRWGGAKVSCILCHRGVQLILAYSWARPAILVVGKGSEVMFLFRLFLHFHSCSSFFPVPLFHLFCYLFCRFFSHSLGDDTKWPTRVDVSLNPNTINQPEGFSFSEERPCNQ